jgi:hypothetical protein
MADSGVVNQLDTLTEHERISRLSCVDAIRERKGDVVCFTPGLIVTQGGMPVDPIREFATRFPADKELQPFCVAVPQGAPPFFSGIGVSQLNGDVVDWDRRLYGIQLSRAAACFDFLAGIGLKNGNAYASVVQYEINIPDPTKPLIYTPIHVTIFGVLAADTITYLAPQMTGPPRLATTDAAPHLQASSYFKVNQFAPEALQKLKEAL